MNVVRGPWGDDDDAHVSEAYLLIVHPDIDPERITRELGLAPTIAFRAGDPVVTPKGSRLPGTRPDTRWRYCAPPHARRDFFAPLGRILDHLAPHRTFLRQLMLEGGLVEVAVNLSGERNIGDVITPEDIRKLADLGIALGVEVFPELEV